MNTDAILVSSRLFLVFNESRAERMIWNDSAFDNSVVQTSVRLQETFIHRKVFKSPLNLLFRC